MKDKEKQIEEIVRFIDTHIMAKKIAELIPSKIVSYDGRSKGQHLYIEQKMEIAKEMMKQGVVVWTMDEHAKLVSQVRQEFEHEYKDKVVLSREEAEKLVKENEKLAKQCEDWCELTLKKRNQIAELKDRIAELEKENATKTDTITDLLKKQEFYETEKLKKFTEKLKDSGEIKALLEMKTMPKVFEHIYNNIVQRIDETLKEFIND